MGKEIKRESYVNVDFFKDVLDVEEFLVSLDNILNNLESDTLSDEEKVDKINQFKEEAKKLEVVVCAPHKNKVWIQIPVIFHDVQYELSSKERIASLFKKGVFLKKNFKKRDLDIVSNVERNLKITATYENFLLSERKEINDFYCIITFIMIKVAEVLEQFGTAIAIYKKPHGIIAGNVLRSFIEEIEAKHFVKFSNLKNSIETVTLYNIIEDSEVFYEKGVVKIES